MQRNAHAHEEAAGSSLTPAQVDHVLVDRTQEGDQDAFAQLIQRHKKQVFAILNRYERDNHRVEDLAQDTFLKAWRRLGQYRASAPFQHWISRIAVNVALDHIRRATRRIKETGFDDLGETSLDWLRTDDCNREMEKREARELLAQLLNQLSAADRMVITLQSIEGRNVEEIRQLTGWSAVSVRVRAHRARGRLRAALQTLLAEEQRQVEHPRPLTLLPQAA
jgi:RNA polymerase sigma-70 factor (ECF subfamily)